MPERPHNKPFHTWLPWVSYNTLLRYLATQSNRSPFSEHEGKCSMLGVLECYKTVKPYLTKTLFLINLSCLLINYKMYWLIFY